LVFIALFTFLALVAFMTFIAAGMVNEVNEARTVRIECSLSQTNLPSQLECLE
jgi:F0F1-type ATP synthase membrane subunit b/b'